MNKRKFILRIGSSLMLSSVLFSACSVLPDPKPASVIYRLSVPDTIEQNHFKSAHVINIETPTIPKALDGVDIVLSPDGRRLTAASGAQWSAPITDLLRNVLIDTLSAQKGITGIIPTGNTRVPYRLNMDVRRFEAVFDNGADMAPNAVVQVTVSLTQSTTRKLVGSYTVKKQVRAQAVTVSSIVAAQDRAANEAMQETATWISSKLPGSIG